MAGPSLTTFLDLAAAFTSFSFSFLPDIRVATVYCPSLLATTFANVSPACWARCRAPVFVPAVVETNFMTHVGGWCFYFAPLDRGFNFGSLGFELTVHKV